MEAAMAAHPRLHFVSTGGPVPGLDTDSYARFEQLVARSAHRSRYHLEGWVRADAVAAYVSEADLGVLAERPIYEGLLGSKNRVLQWMGAGLPVLYNRVGDLGDVVEERGLGLTFAAGDAAGLTERLLWAAAHRDELRRMAERAREVARRELTFEATTRELAAWAAAPAFAPDAGTRTRVRRPEDHATVRQRVAGAARRVPLLRGSEGLVRLWRRLLSRSG
jgi:glycosyltransferase involved in cell wall biosynthesis